MSTDILYKNKNVKNKNVKNKNVKNKLHDDILAFEKMGDEILVESKPTSDTSNHFITIYDTGDIKIEKKKVKYTKKGHVLIYYSQFDAPINYKLTKKRLEELEKLEDMLEMQIKDISSIKTIYSDISLVDEKQLIDEIKDSYSYNYSKVFYKLLKKIGGYLNEASERAKSAFTEAGKRYV